MLTALMNHRHFTTILHTKEELLILKKNSKSFTCPHCSSPLILKVGNIKIPHFAHTTKLPCLIETKKETPDHIWSKALLYDRLSAVFQDVKLESYIKELQQIPDLLITVQGNRVAIEIQCSTIPLSEIRERTEGYRREKIHPLWILTQPLTSAAPLKLTSFQQGFIRFSEELHFFLLHFDPAKKTFTLFPHLTPVSTNSFCFSKKIEIPLGKFTIPISILPPDLSKSSVLKNWNHYRGKWVNNKIHFSSVRRDPFLSEVYREGDTVLYLPLFIGLPVLPHMTLIKTNPVQWQYYMWKDVLKRSPYFTKKMIYRAFRRRLEKGNIETRNFPLQSTGSSINKLIDDYLNLLEKFNLIQKAKGGGYSLSYDWNCPKTFNEFQQHCHDFFPKMKHILKKD
jgi:competence protein CoiA